MVSLLHRATINQLFASLRGEYHNGNNGPFTRRVLTLVSQARLKPNSITLAGSELVRSWFEAGSCQIPLH